MKLFNNPFKKKDNSIEILSIKDIPKKKRKRAELLLKEYEKGLVIKINKDINQKELMDSIRKEK